MDDEQFHDFYAACGPALVGQLYAMTGDAGLAQDCVQEAFITAWKRRASLDLDLGNPQAWVRTTAWRYSLNHWRRASRQLRAYQRHGLPPDVEPPSPESADLYAKLRQLPTPQRHVVVLHYLCDLSVEDIAAETGLALGTVKSRLYRARAALAAQLRPAAPITLPAPADSEEYLPASSLLERRRHAAAH